MKILQVTPAYPPSAHGGISTHVGLLAKGMVGRGNEVSVATTNRYDSKHVMSFSGWREMDGVSVFYAKAYWPGRYFFAPGIFSVIRDSIEAFDVLHIHDTRTFVGLAASVLAERSPTPYVLTCHGSLSPSVGSTKLKILHDHLIGKGLVRRASRVIALSPAEKQEFLEFGIPEAKIVIVPNAIPLKPDQGAGAADSAEIDSRRRNVVLYLGRLHRIKGVDRLIDAFAIVEQRNRDCRLLIVGQDYGAKTELARRVMRHGLTGKVTFPGPMYGTEKEHLLRNADVLVVPSYRETFPLVVLEAFAVGLPVIVTEGCGISGELERNQAALVVSSTAEMARAIERCLTDTLLVNQLRNDALRLLKSEYNWDRALSRVATIYREVAG